MELKKVIYFGILFLFLVGSVVFAANLRTDNSPYFSLEDKAVNASSAENFTKMMDVLTHKRCVNCHPNDNIPKQGEDSHPHYFGISRGTANVGYEATRCVTCHQEENNTFSGVPGAPEWRLAPAEMFWEGLSRIEIATSMMDPARNGGRSPEETMHHLTEHELVLWAWNPGVNADGSSREKPPVPLEEYKKAVEQWFEDGAIIPEQ